MHIERPTLAIVVPCYNEEDVLLKTFAELSLLLNRLITKEKISTLSKIYFIDDGSKDKTWNILKSISSQSSQIVALRLSRNKGHQNALTAGLFHTQEDIVVSIDADLQDDHDAIESMVDKYSEGYDVVYGVRATRHSDSFFKRFTAESYYKIMKIMGVDLIFNHADFRLMSRRSLNSLKEYKESNIFLRGIVREVGYPSTNVEYSRKAREAGESKYPLKKMLSFAWQGITSFSTAPLRLITILGLTSSLISLGLIFWVILIRLLGGPTAPGWASILLPLLFIGSIQLLSLGVLGEYLAKIYEEVKSRPKFHISEHLQKEYNPTEIEHQKTFIK